MIFYITWRRVWGWVVLGGLLLFLGWLVRSPYGFGGAGTVTGWPQRSQMQRNEFAHGSLTLPWDWRFIDLMLNERLVSASTWPASEVKLLPPVPGFNWYENKDGGWAFLYPSGWDIRTMTLQGGEILSHAAFYAPDKKARGFVQVWQLRGDLHRFLIHSLGHTTAVLQNLRITEIAVNLHRGYLVSYRQRGQDGLDYLVKEVFLKQGERLYRLAFFVPERYWNGQYSRVFQQMVESLTIKG